jgi:hypothetical protein
MPLIPIPSTKLPVQSLVADDVDPPAVKDPMSFLSVNYVGIREESLIQAFIKNVAADFESLSKLLEIDIRDQMARIEKTHKMFGVNALCARFCTYGAADSKTCSTSRLDSWYDVLL